MSFPMSAGSFSGEAMTPAASLANQRQFSIPSQFYEKKVAADLTTQRFPLSFSYMRPGLIATCLWRRTLPGHLPYFLRRLLHSPSSKGEGSLEDASTTDRTRNIGIIAHIDAVYLSI